MNERVHQSRDRRIATTLSVAALFGGLVGWGHLPWAIKQHRESLTINYVGKSSDEGWAIHLEGAGQPGWIAGAIGLAPICAAVVADGRLSFHTAASSVRRYSFTGRSGPSSLDGTIRLTGSAVNRQWSQRLTLRAVGEHGVALNGMRGLEGVYGESVDASGAGTWLVLLADGDSTVALYVERAGSEGYSSAPSRAMLIGDSLRFSPRGREVKAAVRSDTVLLSGHVLTRLGSLDDVAQHLSGGCR